MIDKNKIYDKLNLRYKTKYKVVCFEGGPLQISADAPKHCGANCHVKIIKTFAKNGGGFYV